MEKNDYNTAFDDILILCRMAAEQGKYCVKVSLSKYSMNRWAHNILMDKLNTYGFRVKILHYNQYVVSWWGANKGTEARVLYDIYMDTTKEAHEKGEKYEQPPLSEMIDITRKNTKF